MSDLRSPLAKARDKWMGSDECLRLQAPGATGRFLENRLEVAFIAGWSARDGEVAEARRAALHEAAALVRKYLAYNSQRAVSWHEVEHCAMTLGELATQTGKP